MENASKLGRSCYEKSKVEEFDDGVIKKSWALIKKTVQRHDYQSLYSVYMLRILIS